MSEDLKVLGDTESSTYIVKAIAAHNHHIFVSKGVKTLPATFQKMLEKYHSNNHDDEPPRFMVQRAVKHYEKVVKYYNHCGSIYHCYQESLSQKFLEEANAGEAINRKKLQFEVVSDYLDKNFQFEKVKRYIEFCGNRLDYNSLGFDLILEEGTNKIYCFDCNISVSLAHIKEPQVARVYDRFFNELYGQKVNREVEGSNVPEIAQLSLKRDSLVPKLILQGPGTLAGSYNIRSVGRPIMEKYSAKLINKIGDDWVVGTMFSKENLEFVTKDHEGEYLCTRVLVFGEGEDMLLIAGSSSAIDDYGGYLLLIDDEELCELFDYVHYGVEINIK